MFVEGHWVEALIRKKYGPPILSSIFILFGSAVFCLGLLVKAQSDRLARQGVTTTAQVIATRIDHPPEGGAQYVLRFRFQVPSHPGWYQREDDLIGHRREIWSSLSRSDWEAARTSGRVEIVYLPSNPSICETLAESEPGIENWAGITLGIPFILGGVIWLAVWNTKRKRPAPPPIVFFAQRLEAEKSTL